MKEFAQTKSPEIGILASVNDCIVNYHDHGAGQPILLIHGSGPGVTAWANWRGVIGPLSQHARIIACDMLGFGYTECSTDKELNLEAWVGQLIDLLDELGLESVSVIGNSFGGAIALALAATHPKRVRKLVLMGAVGVSFPITEGLDKVWGYEPSHAAMAQLLKIFTFDNSRITDELVQMRYEASKRSDVQSRYAKLFPVPRQQGIEMLVTPEEAIRSISHQTLIIHGRDDNVIPLNVSEKLIRLIPHSQLHVFGECGHWVQIEKENEFLNLVHDFLCHKEER